LQIEVHEGSVAGRVRWGKPTSTADLTPGDSYRLEPGHDAQVMGNEPFVALEFESKTADTYAKA
jgi:hypothetical protein